ncbi:hypothetical protein [Methylophaga sp.]|uniref:hypothetical protein n=1 Tax=Methylophaga sp. TaxID=2024840 RepID=UPI003F6A0BDC
MGKTSLTLVLPDFAVLFANELNHAALPDNFKMLTHKARFKEDSSGLYHHLISLFNPQQKISSDLPVAELISGSEKSICADPCYLHPDRDKLLLFYRDLDLTIEESETFVHFLQPLFHEMQASLSVLTAGQWLLHINNADEVNFYAKEGLHGQPVTDFLPQGKDASKWITLWNEIQMLLFDCPLNQTREAAGKVPINGLWFWGAEPLSENWQAWSHVSGDESTLEHMAALSQSMYSQHCANYAVMSGKKRLHLEFFDVEKDWEKQLGDLSDNWLKPAMTALRKWQLNELNLIVPEWGTYRLTPLSVWRFWS